ncbi:RNase P modulator RnpM [Alicyclobacillus sp. SO9]|uniref:RNase P modulator RnpM n=1 Tax=Alicyclobacillus sp. SO9 TaxID=2665646 RepID=UPI0018E77824|nr:YlxR family protein [Alicyclobacillus sp. SO9]QQE80843.1 YlxR family protein [Alicyclobacillus sp. SO9]
MPRVKKVPLRKCVGCQNMFEKRGLLRVVLTPEGSIELDDTGKRNGRGAYLCRNADCLKQARKRKALERAFKQSISSQVYEQLEQKLGTYVQKD